MAEPRNAANSPQAGGRFGASRLAWLLVALSLLTLLPGCGGCSCLRTTKTQAELDQELEDRLRREELEKERLKPPLDVGILASEPYDPRQKSLDFFYKPGHWTAAMLPVKANHDDIYGDLELAIVDANNQPLGLTGTPYTLSASRSLALSKKQPKRLEAQVYLPNTVEKAKIVPQITAKRGGRLYEGPAQSIRMAPHQYFLVVLADWPERYAYLEKLDSCHLPKNLLLESGGHELYRVILEQAQKQTALPAHSLFWTSTAVVLWDGAAPEALTPDQQVALLDWLHWGGQLIISGPDSLGTLKDSFLGPYLPATGGAARQLAAEDLQELGQNWPVRGTRDEQAARALKPVQPWSGIELQLQADARFLPNTGQLVAERRVGRGRVVVSAFTLNGSEVVGWRGFDAFFNACLLGHPGRTFSETEGTFHVTWNRPQNDATKDVRDPRYLSQVRYFTRDTERPYIASRTSELDAPLAEESTGPPPSDVASWCDSNGVANAARETLKDAARIEIPSSMFVVWIVAIYLVVLVPLNWLVFKGLDRIEWAWMAAPVIAIVCTGMVIRLAQLDIGFARSATEIAVVELQDDYSRAHVTRYTALYTSLSTEYRFLANDAGAQMLPFPNRLDDQAIRFGRTNLSYRYGETAELAGVRVLSNSTGMVHSEQMLDLKGRCTLVSGKDGDYTLVNDTELPLRGAGVMRIDEENRLFVAWLDEVPAHSSRPVTFEYRVEEEKAGSPWHVYRDACPETVAKAEDAPAEVNRSRTSGTLNIRVLTDLAEQGFLKNPQRRPGDARLVAWTDAAVPGMTIEPAAPQVRKAALVVADLRHGHGPEPASDSNTHKVFDEPVRVFEAK